MKGRIRIQIVCYLELIIGATIIGCYFSSIPLGVAIFFLSHALMPYIEVYK